MDILLGKVTQQAMNYAIRSGIAITSTYAIKQCSRLAKATPKGDEREELMSLQIRLDSKIKIISPAIDMIELIAARGNTSLESAVALTKELRWEIQNLGVRLSDAANDEELLRRGSKRAKSREQNELQLKLVVSAVRRLLERIEDAVPLINLAITTSGVNLSTNLPATVSPSRLLQASTFLTAADTQYTLRPGQRTQVGPVYTLSLYMLFAGHANRPYDEDSVRETTWKEVIHKARVKLVRVPLDKLYDLPGERSSSSNIDDGYFPPSIPGEGSAAEFAYQLMLVEDLDDDRVHTFDGDEPQPGRFEDVALAGIRDLVPIHQVSKIFYADTGKILNIGTDGEINNPVLLLKRDIHAEPPRRMMTRQMPEDVDDYDEEDVEPATSPDGSRADGKADFHDDDTFDQLELDAQILRESTPLPEVNHTAPDKSSPASHWRLPPDLDPEWLAFEVYTEEPDSEDDIDIPSSDIHNTQPASSRNGSLDSKLTTQLARLDLHSSSPVSSPSTKSIYRTPPPTATPAIKTSLSLLEMLIRLTALQQFRQASHLTIEDELLNFFLEDSATTGAGSNAEYRQRVRRDARRRVGFDPYDESPIKRRGEEYLAHPRAQAGEGRWDRGSYYESTPGSVRDSLENQQERYAEPRRAPSMPSSPSPNIARPPGLSSTRSSPAVGRSVGTPAQQGKSRQQVLRRQSEGRPRSPLAAGTNVRGADSTLGSSPAEVVKAEEGE